MKVQNQQMTKLLNLELHEQLELEDYTTVLRVPGGYIYTFRYIRDAGIGLSSQFVKLNEEFISEAEQLSARLK